ncbi:MAG TPA: NRDE family protein, partial [bacterium]
MCLLLLAYQAHPDVPLLLGGNRDEFHSRSAAAPSVIARAPMIFAGQDLEAGGTWMGRNEHGMVAALTNRRDPAFVPPPNVRSRGEIVMGLLRTQDPAVAASWLAAQPAEVYRPFSVLFGNRERFYYFSPREVAAPKALTPGMYALSNSTLDDRSWPKVDRSLKFLDGERTVR